MNDNSRLTQIKALFRKPAVLYILRFLVSGMLLFFLYRLSAFEKISTVFSRIDPLYLIGFFILYFLGVSILSLRWKYLLAVWGLQHNYADLLRWNLTGIFLNNFFPGGLGGDAYRLYSASRGTGKVEDVTATIFYERMLSYTSLVTLGLISLTIRADYSEDRWFWLLLGSIFFGLVVIFFLLTVQSFGDLISRISERFRLLQKVRLHSWFDSFRFKVRQPGTLIIVIVFSFLIQSLDVLSFYLVAQAIHLPVRLGDLFLFVPLLYLAILLPLSINGIGVRETVFVFFASWWGVSQLDAVAFSITVFTLNVAGSLVGGPIYWVDKKRSDIDKNVSHVQ